MRVSKYYTVNLLLLLNFGAVLFVIFLQLTSQKHASKSYTDYEFLQEFNQRFAENHNYTSSIDAAKNRQTTFNCQNYSSVYNYCAKQLGLNSKIVGGCNDNESDCHAWNQVQLDIEPIYGTLVNYEKDYPRKYSESFLGSVLEDNWKIIEKEACFS